MKNLIAVLLALTACCLRAQDVLPLWQGEAPFSKPNALEEYIAESWGVPCANNVTRPTLSVHAARGANSGRAVVVLPGGGYQRESIIAEGREIAEYLAARGVTAAVLKYRLPLPEASDQPQLLPLTDARRALALMRSLAGRYGFDASKIGVLGFSAGGHLATAVSVLPAKSADETPDFSVLVYAVTTLSQANQDWLEETLFHRPMTTEERRQYSLVDHVSTTSPPAFLVHAYDDDLVPIEESRGYAEALTAAGREVETHFFAKGGHGFGPGRTEDGTAQWLGLLVDWLERQ